MRLSNEFGEQAVTFSNVTAATHQGGGHLVPGTSKGVTFAGEKSVTVAAGEDVVSDPVGMPVGDRQELAVSMYVKEPTGPATTHNLARETGYAAPGNRTGDERADAYRELSKSWMYLSGIDVERTSGTEAVVVVGDSLTDGQGSTVGAEHSWPDELADRLILAQRDTPVLNRGIAASRLLRDAPPTEPSPHSFPGGLARLDRDVDDAGVSTVILYLGINDIIQGGRLPDEAVTADELIAGYTDYVDRAHEHGVRVVGATLTPYGSSRNWTPAGEELRQEVNDWIRDGSGFDAVLDLDAAVRDGKDPLRIDPRYDYRDGLHFNDLGYAAMARAVDLEAIIE